MLYIEKIINGINYNKYIWATLFISLADQNSLYQKFNAVKSRLHFDGVFFKCQQKISLKLSQRKCKMKLVWTSIEIIERKLTNRSNVCELTW